MACVLLFWDCAKEKIKERKKETQEEFFPFKLKDSGLGLALSSVQLTAGPGLKQLLETTLVPAF